MNTKKKRNGKTQTIWVVYSEVEFYITAVFVVTIGLARTRKIYYTSNIKASLDRHLRQFTIIISWQQLSGDLDCGLQDSQQKLPTDLRDS